LDFEEFLFFKQITPTLCKNKHYFEALKKHLLEYLTFWWYPEVVLTNDIQSKKLVIKSIIDIIFQKDLLKLIKEEKIIQKDGKIKTK